MLAELLMDVGGEETERGGEASRFWQTLRNSISFIVFAREITTGERSIDFSVSTKPSLPCSPGWWLCLGLPSLLIGSRDQIIGRKHPVQAPREQVIVR
jgi:hypothetical protein